MITPFMQHLWEIILFVIILLSPIPLCLWLLSSAQNKKYQSDLAHSILTTLNYWCGIQVFTTLLLGTIGQFFLFSVIALEVVILLVGVILLLAFRKHSIFSLCRDLFKIKQPLNKAEALIVVSTFLAGIILIGKVTTEVIIDYDSLWYHLPTMARWYQEGNFVRLDEFSRTGMWTTDQITYYPFNWEILCTLFVMPFREDFLVALPNLISWLMLGLSIYLLSVRAGAERVYSMASTALVLSIPLIIQHVNSLHIDLPFATFFLASLYFAIAYSRNHCFVDFCSFITALGMLFGIKLSAVGYAFLPVTILLFLEIRNIVVYRISLKDILKQSRIAIPMVTVTILVSSFIGLYWYLKNFLEVGNPLGTIQISIAGILLFPGVMDLSTLRHTSLANLFHLTNLLHWQIIILQSFVRLQLPFITLLLQVLLLPKLLLSKQKLISDQFLFSLCFFALIGTGYLYWTTPFTGSDILPPLPPQPINSHIGQQARFAIPFMGMLGVIAAVTASSLRTSSYLMAIIVFVSSLLGIVNSTIFDVVRISTAFKGEGGWASAILDSFRTNPVAAIDQTLKIIGGSILNVTIYTSMYIIIFVVMIWGASRSAFYKRLATRVSQLFKGSRRPIVIVMLIGLLAISSWDAREKRDFARQEVYGSVYTYIANNLKPTETLGYSFNYRSYLLYGKHWNQKVLYMPSRSTVLSEWLEDLKQRQISVFAVGPLEELMGGHFREVSWLENSGGAFTPIFDREPKKVFGQEAKKEVTIYRL